jgi:hypothetical protein
VKGWRERTVVRFILHDGRWRKVENSTQGISVTCDQIVKIMENTEDAPNLLSHLNIPIYTVPQAHDIFTLTHADSTTTNLWTPSFLSVPLRTTLIKHVPHDAHDEILPHPVRYSLA